MKKFYSLVLMAAALLIGTNAWAADVTVVNETTGNSTSYDGSSALQSAIDYIGAGQTGTITLNNPINLDAAVVMPHVTGAIDPVSNPNVLNRAGQNITLNLNGKNINGANAIGVIQILKGSLDITGTGEIIRGTGEGTTNHERSVITVYGAPWSKKDQVWTTLTIGENVTVRTQDDTKVYGLCIQNTNGMPAGVSQTTLGYLTFYAKADAPAEACQNGLSSLGCAYGVKVFVNGKVYGKMRGINVLGTINAAPKCDIDPNLTQRQYDAYPYYDYNYPYVNIGATATVWCVNDGVVNENNGGIYGGGYAVYDISGDVHGQTGVYLKSGDFKLTDANIYSTATTVGTSADYHSGKTAGAGIFIGSDKGYAGGQAVELEGDTKVSGGSHPDANGIIDVVATNAQSTGSSVSHVTVEGGTIEGGINLTSNTSEVTTVYGAQITGEVVVAGDTTTVATITPAGTHVTTVEINGKPTIVVSEGDAPEEAESIEDAEGAVQLTADKDTIKAGDPVVLDELQMIQAGAQTLVINEGAILNVGRVVLDDDAQIIVEAGAKFIVTDKQGIIAPSVNNIVLKAEEGNPSIFVFNPEVSSNRHPKATVEFVSRSFTKSSSDYAFQRFGIPTTGKLADITTKYNNADVATYFMNYDYSADDWASIGYINAAGKQQLDTAKLANPFEYYQMQHNTPNMGTVVTFKGELVGNVIPELGARADFWNGYANSCTGNMSIREVLNELPAGSKSVYLNNVQAHQKVWEPYSFLNSAGKMIQPMQPFLVRNTGDAASVALNYGDAVYYPTTGKAKPNAPARNNELNNITIANIVVKGENTYDRVIVAEDAMFSTDFEDGYDAVKFMNSGINMYVSADEKMSIFATDNLEGTYVGLQTVNGGNYTIEFAEVQGEELTLIDHETGARVAMVEGATYEFTANGTNDYRFEIVGRANMPTAIENTEAVKSAKGVYTITGQYVGEMNVWNALPAGVYVVNGEKRVK